MVAAHVPTGVAFGPNTARRCWHAREQGEVIARIWDNKSCLSQNQHSCLFQLNSTVYALSWWPRAIRSTIGAAARAMSNFGFLRLRVVNPYEAAFREARSAVGASVLLASAEIYESVADAVSDCTLLVGTTAARHRELQHPLRRLEYGARLMRKQLASSHVAVLFGSEKVGLSNKDLSHCNWVMSIQRAKSTPR